MCPSQEAGKFLWCPQMLPTAEPFPPLRTGLPQVFNMHTICAAFFFLPLPNLKVIYFSFVLLLYFPHAFKLWPPVSSGIVYKISECEKYSIRERHQLMNSSAAKPACSNATILTAKAGFWASSLNRLAKSRVLRRPGFDWQPKPETKTGNQLWRPPDFCQCCLSEGT